MSLLRRSSQTVALLTYTWQVEEAIFFFKESIELDLF